MAATPCKEAAAQWHMFVQEGLSRLQLDGDQPPLHRFPQPLGENDVIPARDGSGDVLPPVAVDGEDVVGASFFVPVSQLSAAAHNYFARKASSHEPCHNTMLTRDLPQGIAIHQDVLLEFKASRDAQQAGRYPDSFKSMSSKCRGRTQIHGLHYAAYPTRCMHFADFERKVHELYHMPCSVADPEAFDIGALDNRNGGSGDGAGSGTAGNKGSTDYEEWVLNSKTWPPSTQPMRLICEALWHVWQAPESHANDAMLAFMLMHDIGARDKELPAILHDSATSRLIYRAVCGYDAAECAVPNAEGAKRRILQRLEQVLPSALHRSDDSDESVGFD